MTAQGQLEIAILNILMRNSTGIYVYDESILYWTFVLIYWNENKLSDLNVHKKQAALICEGELVSVLCK